MPFRKEENMSKRNTNTDDFKKYIVSKKSVI